MGGRSVGDTGKPVALKEWNRARKSEPDEPPSLIASKAEHRAYWRRRQDALPTNKIPDDLEPHEIEFYEKFVNAGHEVELVPRDRGAKPRPTADFIWRNNGNREMEVKFVTSGKYSSIRDRIIDAVKKGKENFIIDLGDRTLPPAVQARLETFNLNATQYKVTGLWVFARQQLVEINLK